MKDHAPVLKEVTVWIEGCTDIKNQLKFNGTYTDFKKQRLFWQGRDSLSRTSQGFRV